MVGYFSFLFVDENTIKFHNFTILPQYRGLGFGERMLELFLQEYGRYNIIATVRMGNSPAVNLYRKYFEFVRLKGNDRKYRIRRKCDLRTL